MSSSVPFLSRIAWLHVLVAAHSFIIRWFRTIFYAEAYAGRVLSMTTRDEVYLWMEVSIAVCLMTAQDIPSSKALDGILLGIQISDPVLLVGLFVIRVTVLGGNVVLVVRSLSLDLLSCFLGSTSLGRCSTWFLSWRAFGTRIIFRFVGFLGLSLSSCGGT